MYLGVIFISFALIFYTISVWSERIRKKLDLWMVILFVCGFLSDVIGTSVMMMKSTGALNFYKVCGYSALIIMFFHLIWAIFSKVNVNYEKNFTKFSIFAWMIWLVAFLSGVPK